LFLIHIYLARIQQQRDEREDRVSQDIVQKERMQWEALEEVEDDDLLLALAISASTEEYPLTASRTSHTFSAHE
jgi:hypothetical protein